MEELIKLLCSLHPEVDFEKEEGLVSRCIFNSFDIISIVMGIRDRYGVVIPAVQITPENFDSANKIYKLIIAERNNEKR